MNRLAQIATLLTFASFAAEPNAVWKIATKEPLILPDWGTVRDTYGMARFSQNNNALSVEVAGGGTDFGYDSKKSPTVLRDVEGDFEVGLTIQPGMSPEGTPTASNRVTWNSVGLIIEADDGNYIRLEVVVREPLGQFVDNRIWAMHAIRRTGTWYEPELKDWDPKKPMFLRIKRTGAQFTWAYSYDTAAWTELKPFEAKSWPQKLKVGVLFVNLTTKVQKATVSDLKIVPLKPSQETPRADEAK